MFSFIGPIISSVVGLFSQEINKSTVESTNVANVELATEAEATAQVSIDAAAENASGMFSKFRDFLGWVCVLALIVDVFLQLLNLPVPPVINTLVNILYVLLGVSVTSNHTSRLLK